MCQFFSGCLSAQNEIYFILYCNKFCFQNYYQSDIPMAIKATDTLHQYLVLGQSKTTLLEIHFQIDFMHNLSRNYICLYGYTGYFEQYFPFVSIGSLVRNAKSILFQNKAWFTPVIFSLKYHILRKVNQLIPITEHTAVKPPPKLRKWSVLPANQL